MKFLTQKPLCITIFILFRHSFKLPELDLFKEDRVLKPSCYNSLSEDLWIEVLGYVASTSLTDLFNVKMSCKYFSKLAEDFYILQQASLKKIPSNPFHLSKKASSFLKLCLKSGNPESLFRQGVNDYFSLGRIKLGLR